MKRISKAFVLAAVVSLASRTFMTNALAALSGFLIAEFSLSNAQFGLLPTMYTLGGALSAYFAGRVADRVGGRRLLQYHFVLCLIGVVAAAIAPAYGWLLLIVALAGISSTSANPSTNRLIALNVPAPKQASVVGIKATGQPIAVIVAGAVLPVAALAWGWRAAMALGALLPLLGLALMGSVPHDNPTKLRSERRTIESSTNRTVVWIALHGFCLGGASAAVASFLPLFGREAVGMSATQAGALLSLAGLMSLIGRLLWGRLIGRFRHVNVALTWLSLISVVATLILILSGRLESALLVWAAAAVAGLTMLSWNAVGMTAVVSEIDIATAGRASGTVMSAFLAGWMSTPALFGWTLDVTGSFLAGWSIVLGLNLAALLPLMAWRRQKTTTRRERVT